MTPLFCVPDSQVATLPRPPGYQAGASRRAARATGPGRGKRGRPAARNGHGKDPADLLAVTAEWLRRALWRSFLRYNVPGDLDTAVHAAMNVVEPVLEARDAEILRLGGPAAARAPAGRRRP